MWPPLQSAFSFSLRCIVFLLSAAVFADLALYLAVGGLCLGWVELSCPLAQSRASSTSGTVSSAACPCCVELLALSYHILCQARRLEICNIEPGDCAAVCSLGGHRYVLDLAASHHRGRLCFSRHMWSRCSCLRDLDLFPKPRHVGEFPGCPHFIRDIPLVELEKRISAAFLTIITRSLCN